MAFDFKFPDVGEGIHEGNIVKWHVKEGDHVEVDQTLAEVETAKAVVEIPSPKAGTILKAYGEEGETIHVGDTLVTIGEEGETVEEKKEEVKEEAKPEVQKVEVAHPQPTPGRVMATPHTKKLARELNVDITKVNGTGPGGRITDDDVKKFSEGGVTEEKEEKPETKADKEVIKYDFEKYGEIEKVPLKGVRKAIAEAMVRSKYTAPHVTHMDEFDVTELVELRTKEKQEALKKGIHLTYMPFIMKAILVALKKFPYVNSSLDNTTEEIVLKKYYNFGIAVDTDEGLIVPVVKDVDKKSILEIAQEITSLSEKAKERKLTLDELRGHTFTITNIGALGGTQAIPIINYPDVAIFAVMRIAEKAVLVEGDIKKRWIMPISLTFDHRVLDGAMAARFANEIKKHLQDPDLLLVDVE